MKNIFVRNKERKICREALAKYIKVRHYKGAGLRTCIRQVGYELTEDTKYWIKLYKKETYRDAVDYFLYRRAETVRGICSKPTLAEINAELEAEDF